MANASKNKNLSSIQWNIVIAKSHVVSWKINRKWFITYQLTCGYFGVLFNGIRYISAIDQKTFIFSLNCIVCSQFSVCVYIRTWCCWELRVMWSCVCVCVSWLNGVTDWSDHETKYDRKLLVTVKSIQLQNVFSRLSGFIAIFSENAAIWIILRALNQAQTTTKTLNKFSSEVKATVKRLASGFWGKTTPIPDIYNL